MAVLGVSARGYISSVKSFENRSYLRDMSESAYAQARAILEGSQKVKGVDSYQSEWFSSSGISQRWTFKHGEAFVAYDPVDIPSKSHLHMRYGLVDEERKININTMPNPNVLIRLVEFSADLPRESARIIAYSILDWIDEDKDPYDEGAEDLYYVRKKLPYKSKNNKLDHLAELLYVRGVTANVYLAIKPFLTIYSNQSLNINTVSINVLYALGFTESLAQKIINIRLGPDGEPGTDDDHVFADLESLPSQIRGLQGLSQDEENLLESILESYTFAVSSEHFSIHASAQIRNKNAFFDVEYIVKRKGGILMRHEKFSDHSYYSNLGASK